MSDNEILDLYITTISVSKLKDLERAIEVSKTSNVTVYTFRSEGKRYSLDLGSFEYDAKSIMKELQNENTYCFWNVWTPIIEEDSFIITLHKDRLWDHVSLSMVLDEQNEMKYLELLKRIYASLSPVMGGGSNDEIDVYVKPYERPEYFEWILILGPTLARYIDRNKVPKVYEIIDMKDGGMIIHEDILGNRASEEDMNTVLEMIPEDLSFLWEEKEI